MDSITRQFGLLCLGTLAAALTACASNNVSQCDATGVLCPAGTHCAAAQPICISDTIRCGDAHKDADEECDDGNNLDADGCSHLCKIEVCGNGNTDPGEKCDDGNTVSGDGCSADCKSLEICGNNIVDNHFGDPMKDEVCDDGNRASGDGCSADCLSTEVCGNGIKDIHEKCDDKGAPGGCNDDCQGGTGCGDGAIDKDKDGNPIEECDDGNTDNTDDCLACRISRCGDGVKQTTGNRPEACDGSSEVPPAMVTGLPILTAGCNLDCTVPSCGDKIVNPLFTKQGAPGPEQCDPPDPAHGCSADCQFEHCGNNIKDPEEECDGTDFGPGGANGQTCAADCHIQKCGNGRLDPGELCDDGNAVPNDGCSGGSLAQGGCKIEFCGDGITNDKTEECDGGENGIPQVKPNCNANCKIPTCGDGIVNPLFTPMLAPGGEQCDPPSVANGCSTTCQFEHCGNGIKDPGEECDKTDFGPAGNPNNLTCAADCHIQQCNNGRLDPGEQCDDGAGNNDVGKRCNATCQLNVCGDLDVLNGVEQCDPGRNMGTPKDTDTCDHDCTLAVCGDTIVNAAAHEDCDDGAANGTVLSMNSCDKNCKFNSCGNGIIDLATGEECDPGGGANPMDTATCTSTCKLSRCGDGHTNPVNETCDDGPGLNGIPCAYGNPFCSHCNATCTGNVSPGGPFCGDFLVQTGFGEACDPATGPSTSSPTDPPSPLAKADAATCDIDCTTVTCGDGHLNTLALESCDDGNQNACGTCPSTTATGCRGATPITPTQAHSTVQASAAADANGVLIQPGDSFTLDDGFGRVLTFTFVEQSGGGNTEILFQHDPADSAATIASAMASAIHSQAQQGFGIDASVPTPPGDPTTVILTSKRKSSRGNTAIGHTGLIQFVFGLNGTADQMDGGLAGNCAPTIGCVLADDCESGFCSSGKCTPCTTNTQCPASTTCNVATGKCH